MTYMILAFKLYLRIRDGFLVTHPDDPDDEDYEQEIYIKKDKHYYS